MALPNKIGLDDIKPVNSKKSSLSQSLKDEPEAARMKIGQVLCKEGHITSSQLDEALDFQKKNKGRLGSILLRLGYIEEETIVNVLSRIYSYPPIIISKLNPEPDPEAVKAIPYEMAKKHMAFPFRINEKGLEITMTEPVAFW